MTNDEYDGVADLKATIDQLNDWANEPYSVATDTAIGLLSDTDARWYLRAAIIALSTADPVKL